MESLGLNLLRPSVDFLFSVRRFTLISSKPNLKKEIDFQSESIPRSIEEVQAEAFPKPYRIKEGMGKLRRGIWVLKFPKPIGFLHATNLQNISQFQFFNTQHQSGD